MSIVIAIIVLGFIIFVHELGHFIVAKAFKVPVREFSIGMGPRIFTKVWHNTRYSLKAFPLGGSCAMIGEDVAGSGDFTEEEGIKITDDGKIDFDGVVFTEEELAKNNFSVIAPWKKFLICLAGPGFNFLLAFLLAFVIVLRIGFDIPEISEVAIGGAAEMATPVKIEKNDRVVGLEIPIEKSKINSYRDLLLFMELNNDYIINNKCPLVIRILRIDESGNKNYFNTVVYPKYDDEYKKAMIGISFSNLYKKPTSFIETCKFAFNEFYFYISSTIKSLRMLFGGRISAKEISGPVGTVAVMGDVINEAKSVNVESVLLTIVTLIILISSNLGVMNLLPIPALDGGRIVFAAIEMIIGRPLDKKFETFANTITMILLLIFMIWIFGMDIYKLINA